jgi:hypothetical protein
MKDNRSANELVQILKQASCSTMHSDIDYEAETDLTLVSKCIICEEEYIMQTIEGYKIHQNNELGMCSLCFNMLRQIIQYNRGLPQTPFPKQKE